MTKNNINVLKDHKLQKVLQFFHRESNGAVIQLRKFIDAFHQMEEDSNDNEEEDVYHREKRNVDRGVT